MAVYTEELNTNFNFPHIDIFNKYTDGTLTRYEARPHEGYVMYDRTAEDVEYGPNYPDDPDDWQYVTYYRTIASIPRNFNFDNFPYVAKPRSEVDENYIFGGGDNDKTETI